ncbi:hypothetical protein [Catellatospora methionotrophica]|uniref:hypothetical protein n=1 Tax=Catellatospora methionotrophica TaxID=121620 RepID=UPI0014083F5C|nr:hypothetical protein [Catellatospora methionotrophica]
MSTPRSVLEGDEVAAPGAVSPPRVPRQARAPIGSVAAPGWPVRIWTLTWLPLLAYLLGHVLHGATAYWLGFDWLDTGSRIRWDGGIYLGIAETGYSAGRCAEVYPSGPKPDGLCGSAGWFPLLPYLVLVLMKLGLSSAVAGVLVVEMCGLGMLVVLARLLAGAGTAVRAACLAVAALLPSGVYFHATFPISLAVLLILVTFLLLARGRWGLAGLAGMVAATAYPLAVLLAPAAVVFLLIPAGRWAWRRLAVAAYVGGMTGAGVLAVFGVMQLTTGRWDAYLAIQSSNYGHGVHNPVTTYLTLLEWQPHTVSAELLFSTGLVLLAVVGLVIAAVRRRATALDWALGAVYGPLLLITPLVVGAGQAQFRSHTLLLPVVLLLRHLRWPVAAGVAALASPLTFLMTGLFLTRALV